LEKLTKPDALEYMPGSGAPDKNAMNSLEDGAICAGWPVFTVLWPLL
jgi:hypothetical protein